MVRRNPTGFLSVESIPDVQEDPLQRRTESWTHRYEESSMKSFSFSPVVTALFAASVLSGCAGVLANADTRSAPMAGGMAGHHKMMSEGACSCCTMHKGGMSHDMKPGQSAPQQGAMCMPGKDAAGKSGCSCCDMGKMGSGGCECSGMGKR